MAWLTQSAAVGAGDPADVIANVSRAAAQVSYALGGQLAKAIGGSLIILDIDDVKRRNHIGEHLRKLAAELVGKTLYHPEVTLNFYADEVNPPLDELRRLVKVQAQNSEPEAK